MGKHASELTPALAKYFQQLGSNFNLRALLFALTRPLLTGRALLYLIGLPITEVVLDRNKANWLKVYFEFSRFGVKKHCIGQSVVVVDEFENWLKNDSRRNVRKAFRKSVHFGFETRRISRTAARDYYTSIEISNGRDGHTRPWRWTLDVTESETELYVGVFNSNGECSSISAGVKDENTSVLFVNTSLRGSEAYIRWASMLGFIKFSTLDGGSQIFCGPVFGVSPGNQEFQRRFGFNYSNVAISNL
jgi:hypothetical protein